MAQFVSSLTNVQEIQVLKAGIKKYTGLGRTHELVELNPPSNERISPAVDIFTAYGLKVKVGGQE